MKNCKICNEEFTPKHHKSSFCDKDHYRPCKFCEKDYLVKKVSTPPEFCSGSCGAKYRNSIEIKKNCEICDIEFISTNGKKFCDNKHYGECLKCGKRFEHTNLSKRLNYCSHSCSVNDTKKIRNCKRCGAEFKARGKQVYCDNPHYSNCEHCGKKILEKLAKRTTRFCSTSCSSKHATSISKFSLTCILCDKQFEGKTKHTKICSATHYKKCEVCRKDFEIPNKYKIPDTCSSYCASQIIDYELRLERTKDSMLKKYGVTNAFLTPEAIEGLRKSQGKRISKINRKWKEDLETEFNLKVELEQNIANNYYADLKIGDLYIDINPTISHNSSINFLHKIGFCSKTDCGHKPKDPNYHYNRFLDAEENGREFIQYFDWYDKEIFLSIIRSKLKLDENKVYAKKTTLKEISQKEANIFFQKNHLLGAASGQKLCLGLYSNGELVHVQTYGPARMNKTYEWEAIRSCTKMNWAVVGGFSKCDKYFFEKIKPKSVISYVDLSISTGSTELMFPGWKTKSTNAPSGTWGYVLDEETRGKKPLFIRDLTARKISADRLLGLEVGDKYPSHHDDGSAFSNDEVLLLEGYLKVYDAGTRTFIWQPS